MDIVKPNYIQPINKKQQANKLALKYGVAHTNTLKKNHTNGRIRPPRAKI